MKHRVYSFFRLFRSPDTSLSKEDAAYVNSLNNKAMVNTGRATLGGTKPMYIYKETGEGGKTWLYKEAVTCIGGSTPHRAYVTEEASKLQRYLFGEDHYVPVFVAKNEQQKAIGTFQKKVDTMANPTVDLFRWQKNPSMHIDEAVTRQVMREHVLDWLIGNFDTKGENFLQKADGSLVSIDKEAAFSHLDNPRAEHMSRTVKLHNNDTIYNVMFSQFVTRNKDNQDPMFLDFDSVEEYIIKIENLSDQKFLEFFDGFLTEKFGSKDGSNPTREEKERQILARKKGLRREYKVFFVKLIDERMKQLIGCSNKVLRQFHNRYPNCLELENNTFIYKFPSERV